MKHLSPHTNPPDKETAFLQMVQRQKDLIWHICNDYTFSPAWETEDAFQEALCVLWRDFDTFRGDADEKTWVYRVTTNSMLMIKRTIRNQPQTALPSLPTDSAADTSEDYDTLMQLVDLLPETDACIVRAHLDGFSHNEIAAMLALTPAAVAMRLSRARKWIRKNFDHPNR